MALRHTKSLERNRIGAIILLLALFSVSSVDAIVRFNFSSASLIVTEEVDLSSRLFIVKTGEHESNINITVNTILMDVMDHGDIIANRNHTYVFTTNTTRLPIATEIVDDQEGEAPETFRLCLERLQSQSQLVMIVEPSCVNITILDDDSVLVGYTRNTTSANITEGGPPQTICVEKKPEGLGLDPRESLQLELTTTAAIRDQVNFPDNPIYTITEANSVVCQQISAVDDMLADGSHTSNLNIRIIPNDVPANFYPMSNTIPIVVRDDDVVTFTLHLTASTGSQTNSISMVEGQRKENLIVIEKSGANTTFTYNITLSVEALSPNALGSDVLLNATKILFEPSTTSSSVTVHIPDNMVQDNLKRFRISILEPITNNEGNNGALTKVHQPIELNVYDNDFVLNTTVVKLAEGSDKDVCVKIFGLEAHEIDPQRNIPLIISTNNAPANLKIDKNEIILNATNPMSCVRMSSLDNNECNNRAFTFQLNWTNTDKSYNVTFNNGRHSITITIDDSKDCTSSSSNVAAVAIPVVFVPLLIIAIIGTVAALLIYFYRRKNKREYSPRDTEKKCDSADKPDIELDLQDEDEQSGDPQNGHPHDADKRDADKQDDNVVSEDADKQGDNVVSEDADKQGDNVVSEDADKQYLD